MAAPRSQRQTARALLAARGMARLVELKAAGITAATLSRMVEDGEVVRVMFRKLSNKRMLSPAQQREAERFVKAKAGDIARKWNEYFVLHKHVAPERITKRIK